MKGTKNMKKNFAKTALITALTGALIAGSALSVAAAPSRATITKNLNVEGEYSYIDTSFSLTVANGEACGKGTGENEANAYAGVTEGLTAEAATFEGTYSEDTTGHFNLSLNGSTGVFTKPGVYHYTLQEAASTVDGITIDPKTYDAYLYVVNDGSGALVSNDITIYDPDGSTKITSITNTYMTNYVTLQNTLSGNAADMESEWDFTIVLNGQAGDQFTVVQGDDVNTVTIPAEQTSVTTSVTLAHQETVTIYGLSASDTYAITEDDADTDGYTTSVSSGNASGSATGNTVVFENAKGTTVAAGLMDNTGTGVLLAVIGAGVVSVFVVSRKRKNA